MPRNTELGKNKFGMLFILFPAKKWTNKKKKLKPPHLDLQNF